MLDYRKLTVLIVEDDDSISSVLREQMESIGVTKVHRATDGTTGLEELIRVHPHLVFCDIHMKPMDGLAFLSAVQAMAAPDLAQTPVVFLTGDPQQETLLRARHLKARGYLVKPVSLIALKNRIDSILGH